IATNAYTPALGWKRRALAPLRVSLFETEPLSQAQLGALAGHGPEGGYTAPGVLESYRLTLRGTIVGGSRVIRYAWGSRLPQGYDPDAFAVIEPGFRERLPALAAACIAAL